VGDGESDVRVEPPAPSRPNLVRGLALACHPLPTVAVTALATAYAVAVGRGLGGSLLVAATVLVGQLSIGWCNDAVDAVRDVRAGRRDKPVVTGSVSRFVVARAAGVALLVSVPLSFANGWLAGAVHLLVVASGWAYDLGLKATVASWLPYGVAFGALPAFASLGLPGAPWPPWWVLAAGTLLGIGAHLANVLPDVDDDLAADVRGLPQRLGRRRTAVLMPVPLLLATAALVVGPAGPVAAPGVVALAAAALLAATATALGLVRGSTRLPMLAAIGVAIVGVALLVAAGITTVTPR